MRPLLLLLITAFFYQAGKAQTDSTRIQVAEAACGQCRFGLKKEGCDLAVRFRGKAYFVDGTGIDDHGDAHAADGFCNTVRKAEIRGKIVGDRFVATYFKLVSETVKKD